MQPIILAVILSEIYLGASQSFSNTPCPLVASDFAALTAQDVASIQSACDPVALPDQQAFCSSCMCVTSTVLASSVDRTGKVIQGTNYSSIIAAIPTNPMLAASSGLSNCGTVTSQVLQETGAMNATTHQTFADCQKLDPLVLLRIYRGCKFNATAAIPSSSGASALLADVLASGVVPSQVVAAGQTAAAVVTETVDDVKHSQLVETVKRGGASPVQVVSAAVSDLKNIFNIRG